MIVDGSKIGGEIVGKDVVKVYIQTDIKTAENVLDGVRKDKRYNVEIKQYRKKRSLDANSYYWVLVGKISDVLSTSKAEIHNQQMAKYGVFKRDADGKLICSLERDGNNYLAYETRHLYPTDSTEDRKGVAYRWYIELKGSSEFDTKEMANLIDGTVADAKEIGIETLPPEELERMKMTWQGKGL